MDGREKSAPGFGNRGTCSMTLERRCPQVWTIGRQETTIVCHEGSLWLTRTGDPADILLEPGESLLLVPGQWVVDALEPSRVQTTTIY